jgi:hypothetical protein
VPSAARQLPVLVRRNAEIIRRSALAQAVLAAAPAAVLLAFAILIGGGAYNGPGASLAWPAIGGFCIGMAYGLPHTRGEFGVLRAERFCGLSATAYILARLALLVPALAVGGAVALAVPAGFGRLPHGYGPGYLTLLLSGAVALTFALLLAATVLLPAPALVPATTRRPRFSARVPTVVRSLLPPRAPSAALSPSGRTAPRPVPSAVVLWLPALLLAGAVLTLLDRPAWPYWVVLGALGLALTVAAIALIIRRVPASPQDRSVARF